MRILIIEDDASLRRGISFRLAKEGYQVDTAANTRQALDGFQASPPDVVLLDVGLPDGDGFALCTEFRKRSDSHIIFLTALDEEHHVVTGYDMGADDYITKPFNMMVLLSKMRAIESRLPAKTKQAARLVCGDMIFDEASLTLKKRGTDVPLTKNELKLLGQFMRNPGIVFSKESLLTLLWDIDGNFVDENTLAVNIRRLREKIEDDPAHPRYVQNIRGIGYRWSKANGDES